MLANLNKSDVPANLWPYLRLAIKEALQSPHSCFKHSAVITKGGSILGVAHNHHSGHAERTATHKVDPKALKGADVWSLRISKKATTLSMAKPCPLCHEALKESGVRNVYYTTSDRTLRKFNFISGEDVLVWEMPQQGKDRRSLLCQFLTWFKEPQPMLA